MFRYVYFQLLFPFIHWSLIHTSSYLSYWWYGYMVWTKIKNISGSDLPRLGTLHLEVVGSLELGPLTALPLCFLKLSLHSLLPCFVPRRRRLGERRRHLSCLRPALRRRRAHPLGMPATSLSFCRARRSTPNPNKTICIRIWFQLQYKPTNFEFVCKNYRVYMCTPMSYAGPAPVTVFRLMCVLVEFRNANFQNHWIVLIKDQWITTR